jgi:LmbE family N-acetylglucosaminyl deacetylase
MGKCNRLVLAFSPHADDITIYCGGTLARMRKDGFTFVAVRITDDYTDSIALSREETIERNREECNEAYKILGADEVVHFDYPSDSMANISEIELRGRMVFLIRKYRPFSLVGFDPDGMGEENLDHVVAAWSMAEASWTCGFRKHYPEHFEIGVEPVFVPERILYSRYPKECNWCVDISDTIDIKIKALQAQCTMMEHIFYQYEAMSDLCGVRLPYEKKASTDSKIDSFFRAAAKMEGQKHGYSYAESMRRVFAGGPIQTIGTNNE